MKGTKHQANKQPFPREPAALKQLKFSHLESEKLLSSQCISCPHCGKSYPRPSQGKMVEHLSSFHNTVITYPCQYCDKQFTCQSTLTAHTVRHQMTQPWQCDKCGYKPVDLSNFVKHVKSVHGVAAWRQQGKYCC